MLVDGNAVEAELGGEFEFVEIPVVQFVALLRIEVAVRQHHPGGAVLIGIAHVQIRVGHEMENEDFHRAALRMNCDTSLAKDCGCSICGMCAQSGSVAMVAPAIRSFSADA